MQAAEATYIISCLVKPFGSGTRSLDPVRNLIPFERPCSCLKSRHNDHLKGICMNLVGILLYTIWPQDCQYSIHDVLNSLTKEPKTSQPDVKIASEIPGSVIYVYSRK